MSTSTNFDAQFVVRFRSLDAGREDLKFPCDESGRVNMDSLTERTRINYLFARAMIGLQFGPPAVAAASLH